MAKETDQVQVEEMDEQPVAEAESEGGPTVEEGNVPPEGTQPDDKVEGEESVVADESGAAPASEEPGEFEGKAELVTDEKEKVEPAKKKGSEPAEPETKERSEPTERKAKTTEKIDEKDKKKQSTEAWKAMDSGKAATAEGKLEVARDCLETALRMFEELGDKEGMAAGLFALGVLAVTRAEYGTALREYNQALAIYREVENVEGEAEIHRQLGVIHYLRGEEKQAQEKYKEAAQLLESM
jgi:tetratricopeptide (TPR) repeat protein